MGIPLLTPTAIKDSRREDLNQIQRRSTALAVEETSLVHSLNLTRDSVEEQKNELETELIMFSAQAEDRKAVIREEIASLEKKRDLILAPIEGREKAVAEKENGVLLRENAITKRERKVRTREEEVKAREEALPAREQAIQAREDAIQPKEEEQTKREKSIKASMEALDAEKKCLRERVRAHNEHVENVKAANDADAKANAIERERIQKRQVEQDNKDIEIKDRYEQLARTAKELGIPT